MLRLILIVTLACFLTKVKAVTDEEFQELSSLVHEQAKWIADQDKLITEEDSIIEQLTDENRQVFTELENLNVFYGMNEPKPKRGQDETEMMQNATIEERVSLLETQVTDMREDITEIDEDVTGLDEDVKFLFDDQVIQDERLFSLEDRMLDNENNVVGLQMTDINLDARITDLEENGGGGGGSQTETIAFHAALTDYEVIPGNGVIKFNQIFLNEGKGYNRTTGRFTVPSGGSGLYYFSTYLLVGTGEIGQFDMELNDDVICSAQGDHEMNSDSDTSQATCSAMVSVVEGDEVKLRVDELTDSTPLVKSSYHNGFNGFRI